MKKYLFALLTGFCLASFPLMACYSDDEGDSGVGGGGGVTLAQLFIADIGHNKTLETTDFCCSTAFLKKEPTSAQSSEMIPQRMFSIQIKNQKVKKEISCHPLFYDLSAISTSLDLATVIEEQCRNQLNVVPQALPTVEEFQMIKLRKVISGDKSFAKLIPGDLSKKTFDHFMEEGKKSYGEEMALTERFFSSQDDFFIQIFFNSPCLKSLFSVTFSSKAATDEPEHVLKLAKPCPVTASAFFEQIAAWVIHTVQNEVIKLTKGGTPSMYG